MARNGSGTFNRLYDWTDDRDGGIKILAERMDAEMDGMATALSQSIASDGQTTTSARVPFGVGITVPVGSVSAPSINIASDSNTGVYSSAADTINISCGGTNVAQFAVNNITLMGSDATGITGVVVASKNSSAAAAAYSGFACRNDADSESGTYITSAAGGTITGLYGAPGNFPVIIQSGASYTTRISIAGTSGVVTIPGVTASTGTTTGALVVGGGLGVGENIFAAVAIVAGTGMYAKYIELGEDGVAGTPYCDFHSGASPADYDCRIISSGGTGSNGAGTLQIISATTQIFGTAVIGNAPLATNASSGFLYIPTCAGTPTGTPTGGYAGSAPMIYDTTNHQFWFYDSGWKQPKTPAAAAIVTWQ